MWILLTEAKFLEQCTGPEVAALKTAALGTGQAEPLTATLAKVVQEVRGYVAACAQNQLGAGSTIPEELEADAVAIVRFRAINRLPSKGLLTDTRITEYKDAVRKLEQTAACKFAIEQPATVSSQVTGGPGVEIVSSTTRRATREKLSGL